MDVLNSFVKENGLGQHVRIGSCMARTGSYTVLQNLSNYSGYVVFLQGLQRLVPSYYCKVSTACIN